MCADEGYCTAPKSRFICLCCCSRPPKPPTGAYIILPFTENAFFLFALVVTQKRTNVFLLGVSWSKLPAFIRHCACTVKSPAFRTCQNYFVCTAVLLNIVQNAWKSACQGFLEVQTQIRAVGHLQQGTLQEFHIFFGIFAFWLFWKHEIEGQGHCYGFNCLLASAKIRIPIFVYVFHPHTMKVKV